MIARRLFRAVLDRHGRLVNDDHHDPVLVLTTGPASAYSAVLRAIEIPTAFDGDPAFQRCYAALVEAAQTAWHTRFMPVVLQGEPVFGSQPWRCP